MRSTARGIVAGVLLLIGLYCELDPFEQSAIHNFPDFKAHKVNMPPWSVVPTQRDAKNLLQNSEIKFLDQVQGPGSMAFDPLGRGPYTGLADGRIVFWDGDKWTDFAHTSDDRLDLCEPKRPPLHHLKNEHICGRPLGLRFDKKTGDLYIADAYLGLMKVGTEGGLAKSLSKEAEGVPLRFTNDLDIDDEGNVYFTDSSTKYQSRNYMQLAFSAEDSGRVLKYNPTTQKTSVLERDIQLPKGVSLGKDGSFFVFSEGSIGRIRKYWLKGEKAGTSEVLAILSGFPDSVRTNEEGDFWVALHNHRTAYDHMSAIYPKLREFLLKLPIPAKIQVLLHSGGRPHGVVVKYSPDGKLMQILEDSEGKVVKSVSEVEERNGKLWMGSPLMPFAAVYDLA